MYIYEFILLYYYTIYMLYIYIVEKV